MAKTKLAHDTLMTVCAGLEARYGKRKQAPPADFIQNLIHQILEVGTSDKDANAALERIASEYIDWNDMRVASVRELMDILGADYPRCKEKAEDLSSLLADLYTAFRRMDLTAVIPTPAGIQTLRALPETTLIKEDMVEQALLCCCGLKTFPCDYEQMQQLAFFQAAPSDMDVKELRLAVAELLSPEEMLRLAHGLRFHQDFQRQHGADGPQPVSWGWSKPCPITKAKPVKLPDPPPFDPGPMPTPTPVVHTIPVFSSPGADDDEDEVAPVGDEPGEDAAAKAAAKAAEKVIAKSAPAKPQAADTKAKPAPVAKPATEPVKVQPKAEDKGEPKPKAEVADKPKPADKAKPVEKAKPTDKAKPADKAKPVEKAKPAEKAHADTPAKPAEKDKKPADKAKPDAKAKPADKAKPDAKAKPSADKAKSDAKAKPADKAKPAAKKK